MSLEKKIDSQEILNAIDLGKINLTDKKKRGRPKKSQQIINTSSNKIKINDIGFDYPSDLTLRPTAKLPQILKITPFSVFDYVGVSSVGVNYSLAPDLIVIDSYTNNLVDDVELRFNIASKSVEIIKNTNGIYNVLPVIMPINNSNGIPISNITFNNDT